MPVIAAVDVGSNAIRLSIMNVEACGRAVPVDIQRYGLRLGTDTYAQGRIGKEARDEMVRVFLDISRRMRRNHVEKYRAVATASLRDAANGADLVHLIRKTTSVSVEIIDGKEESLLVQRALKHALGTVPPHAVFMDLGGGSLELILCRTGRARSLALGTVRLLEIYPWLAGRISVEETDEVRRAIRRELRLGRVWWGRDTVGVGTGGNLDALARILPRKQSALPAIDLARLPTLVKSLSLMPAHERAARFNLRSDRADIILPAAIVLEAVAARFHAQAVVVPGTGLRQAVLHDLAATACAPREGAPLRTTSAARRVVARSQALFAVLSPLHNLWSPAEELLCATAVASCAKGIRAANVCRTSAPAATVPRAVRRVLEAIVAIARKLPARSEKTLPRLEWLTRLFVLRLGLPAPERRWAERLLKRALAVRVAVR
jgi:exopolyphosphatase/pppGpp-phosphohydrolase